MLPLSTTARSDVAFRAEASRVELLSADVALILHQESLDRVPQTGATAASPGALRVYEHMYQLRPRLESARVRGYEQLVPKAVTAQALVKAAVTGQLTTQLLVGTGVTEPAARLRALARVWPVLMEIMREVHPRDATVPLTFLGMAHEAFDVGSANPQMAVQMVVTASVEAMARRFMEWLRGVGDMPSWTAVRDEAAAEAQRVAVITGALSPSSQDTRSQAAKAAAKEKREAEAAAAAAEKPPPEAAAEAPAESAGGSPSAGRGRGKGGGGK
jgi:hypothetical protein